jgi:peptidoglycan/xylan/chitin deacetylase (PgdA/CDA1 family)
MPRFASAFVSFCKDSVAPSLCAHIPSRILGAVTDANPVTAYYHIVSDEQVPHVRHLYPFRSVREFVRDVETFCRTFKPIALQDFVQRMRSGGGLPPNSVLITFDDGFREVAEIVAPILLKKGVPATFFLITGCLDNADMAHHNKISLLLDRMEHLGGRAPKAAVEHLLARRGIEAPSTRAALLSIDYVHRSIVDEVAALLEYDFGEYLAAARPYLTSSQVEVLVAQGFAIGGHSIDHPAYSLLDLREQVRQTRESVGMLRRRFSLDYGAFAFPHGDDRVPAAFFPLISADGCVDISFGTAGIVKDRRPGHLQRFSTENTPWPAERVIGRYYARSVFKALTGQGARQ